MNKQLFEFAQNNLGKKQQGSLKKCPSSIKLHEVYNFGTWSADGKTLLFNVEQREGLIRDIQLKHKGLHLLFDSYPEASSREEQAQIKKDEKNNALPVTKGYVLLNSLEELKLNKEVIQKSSLNTLGQYIKADEIHSIEHSSLILVENLAVMGALKRLLLPEALHSALWIYRGDAKKYQQTGTAYRFFRRWNNSHQLICFSDFDPEGLKIAATSHAQHWLAPAKEEWEQQLNIELEGYEEEWFKQKWGNNKQQPIPESLNKAFETMAKHKKTLQQEHMIAHKIRLQLHPLT